MTHYVGIDISEGREGQAVAVLNEDLYTESLYVQPVYDSEGLERLADKILELTGPDATVAIAGPRLPRASCEEVKKHGRDAERELKTIHRTPCIDYFDNDLRCPLCGLKPGKYGWMRSSFILFDAFAGRLTDPAKQLIETVPSIGFKKFERETSEVRLAFFGFKHVKRDGRLDLLDAICCALTAHHFSKGLYEAFGDPDEGQIVVPKP
jgi:predicted nuclease with RNAse H fold